MKPKIIVIAGTGSNVGKTTLVCEVLRAFPGWEAIKVTRGHSRSCGRAPAACCISPLLGEQPLILSDPRETRIPGKDTGKYWEAGAAQVHWVIAAENQVETGIHEALARVASPGVIVEGTSLLRFIDPDDSILVMRTPLREIKPSARRALQSGFIRAIYVNGNLPLPPDPLLAPLPVFSAESMPDFMARLSLLSTINTEVY